MKRQLAAIAALAVLAACGTEAVPEPEPPPSPAQIQAEVEAAHRQWAGTLEDHQAAQVLRAYTLDGEYADCMTAKGHRGYDWRSGIALADARQDTGLAGLLEPFGVRQVRDEVLVAAHAARHQHEADNPEESGLERDAEPAADCLDASSSTHHGELDGLVRPAGVKELTEAWYDEASGVLLWEPVSPESIEYVECMTQRGSPPARGEWDITPQLRQLVLQRVAAKAPTGWRMLTDPERREASPRWQAFVKAERAMLDADETCRVAFVNDHIDDVKELQDEFVAEHGDRIGEVAGEWADIRRRATELGWSPGDPFAGYERD